MNEIEKLNKVAVKVEELWEQLEDLSMEFEALANICAKPDVYDAELREAFNQAIYEIDIGSIMSRLAALTQLP